MLRCSTDRTAVGQSADRRSSRCSGPVRSKSSANKDAPRPVRDGVSCCHQRTVHRVPPAPNIRRGTGVGAAQLASVQVGDEWRHRAGRVDAGAVANTLPHHPLAGGVGVDGRGGGRGDPFVAHDRVVLHTEQQHVDLEVFRWLRRRTAGPVHAFHQVERRDGAELQVRASPKPPPARAPGPVSGG